MRTLAELCVRRPVFATMLVASLMVVGAYSFFGLGVDLLPNVDVPTIAVTVTNPGASPEQIETEITRRVEGAVNTISGLDELRSTSTEGQSMVIVTFLLEKDGDVAAQDVRDKVGLIASTLPETAEAPVIQKFDPGAIPILQISISGQRPLREITQIADEQIKQRLESVSGVGQVQLLGGADREIQVRLDPEKMRAFDLTVTEVATALRQQNVELPSGRISQGANELTVRTVGKVTDARTFDTLAIATRGAYVVRLRDIAEVADTQRELRSASFLNGTAAVTLVVQKQSGRNTVTVAKEVKDRLAELVSTLPPDIRTQINNDQSVFIQAALSAIEEHLVLGSILASVVIFFFLANIRTTLIAAIAIPTSLVSTFALISAMGYTLNQITMLALTLMVGVVIDDAIIVLENIYRYVEEKGMTPFQAAIEGTAGDRPGGDGDDALVAGGVRAGGVHGRHRRPLHGVVRPHRCVRGRGLALCVLHADSDAQRPLHQSRPSRTGPDPSLERLMVLQPYRWRVHDHAAVVDGAPPGDRLGLRARCCQHRAAVSDGREEFRA